MKYFIVVPTDESLRAPPPEKPYTIPMGRVGDVAFKDFQGGVGVSVGKKQHVHVSV